jgi:hypothetical protein
VAEASTSIQKKKGNKKEKSHMAAVQGTRTHTHTTKNHRALLNGPHTQADPDRDWKSNMLQSKAWPNGAQKPKSKTQYHHQPKFDWANFWQFD